MRLLRVLRSDTATIQKRNMLHYLPKKNLLAPTVAGLLLFGRHPETYLVQKYVLTNARITSKECTKAFGITRDTANRDFSRLVQLDRLEQKGSGRAIHYVLKE